jgi:hypothetical protein
MGAATGSRAADTGRTACAERARQRASLALRPRSATRPTCRIRTKASGSAWRPNPPISSAPTFRPAPRRIGPPNTFEKFAT